MSPKVKKTDPSLNPEEDKPKKKRGRPKKSEAEKVAPKKKSTASLSLKEAAAVKVAENDEKEIPEKKTVRLGSKKKDKYYYGVGRRKRAIATVRIHKTGEEKITVNEKDYKVYFPYFEHQEVVVAPLKIAAQLKRGEITIKVKGGGPRGQAEAIRLGIARAIVEGSADYRPQLKKAGFLSRDSRKKERKKPGLKRARRAPQWGKR